MILYFRQAEMPDHAHKAAIKELKRLKKMPQHMPEQAMIRLLEF
jgi:ATP-dependent Lon protease